MCAAQKIVEREVRWDVDGVDVHGTLTSPAGSGNRAAVALVAGSGPTDRDWNTPLLPGNNGSGKLLAAALAEAGFVTIRYDKRASGPHARENVTKLAGKISMQSHVDELAGAVAVLAHSAEVDAERIFALTSSEGAIHALNYRRHVRYPSFAGFVLTGVPGRSMMEVMRAQVVPQLQHLPDADKLVEQVDDTLKAIAQNEPVVVDSSLPDVLRTLLTALKNPANLPFARQLLEVNPVLLLQDVQEPVLVVIGKKDIQVDWELDGRALESTLAGHVNVTFAYPENANHVLKYESRIRETLQPAEAAAAYNTEDSKLDPEALAAILAWLERQAEPHPKAEQA